MKFEDLVQTAIELGASEAKLIPTSALVYDPRSVLKCRFGCGRWGKYWTCQPHVGISTEQFREMVDKYATAIIIKTSDPKSGQDISVAIEKRAMMHYGAIFAFSMSLCVQCDQCAYPEPCVFPHLARPSMDVLGIDIGKTVEPLGFTVAFDPEGALLPAWYTMVLLD